MAIYASLARSAMASQKVCDRKIKKMIKPTVDKVKTKLPAGKVSNLAAGAIKISKGIGLPMPQH